MMATVAELRADWFAAHLLNKSPLSSAAEDQAFASAG